MNKMRGSVVSLSFIIPYDTRRRIKEKKKKCTFRNPEGT